MSFTKEEMAERRNYIGASEAAAVMGKSRWGTPLSVWAEKTGELPPENIDDKLYVILGTRLEEVVAELFTAKTGKKVHRVNEAFVHKKHPFLRCHIDRKVEGERAILQCKTASAFKGKEWDGEEIPEEYEIQEHHELACSGYDRAYIACLIGNHKFELKVVERDASKLAYVVDSEVYFWNEFVVPKVMPGLNFIKAGDNDTAAALWPKGDAALPELVLADEVDAMLESLEGLKADAKMVKKQQEEIEAKVKVLLGSNLSARSNNFVVKWSNIEQDRVDTTRLKDEEPATYARFIKKVLSRRFDPRRITATKETK